MSTLDKVQRAGGGRGAARALARARARTVALANGVFDLLHVGHVRYLEGAKALADVLVVAVNSDASTRAYKGPGRPHIPEAERAELVAALACTDRVLVFDEPNVRSIIRALKPDVHVKGTDYTPDTHSRGGRGAGLRGPGGGGGGPEGPQHHGARGAACALSAEPRRQEHADALRSDELLALLACPRCKRSAASGAGARQHALVCAAVPRAPIPVRDGIPDLYQRVRAGLTCGKKPLATGNAEEHDRIRSGTRHGGGRGALRRAALAQPQVLRGEGSAAAGAATLEPPLVKQVKDRLARGSVEVFVQAADGHGRRDGAHGGRGAGAGVRAGLPRAGRGARAAWPRCPGRRWPTSRG